MFGIIVRLEHKLCPRFDLLAVKSEVKVKNLEEDLFLHLTHQYHNMIVPPPCLIAGNVFLSLQSLFVRKYVSCPSSLMVPLSEEELLSFSLV